MDSKGNEENLLPHPSHKSHPTKSLTDKDTEKVMTIKLINYFKFLSF